MKKVLLVAAIMLTGCAAGPKTVGELKNIGFKDSFEVNQNYQQTYRNIKNGFTVCGGTESTWLSPGAVRSELFTDIEQGQIELNLVPTIGQQKPLAFIQIDKKTDNSSTVSIFYRWKESVNKSGPTYRHWANGEEVCE